MRWSAGTGAAVGEMTVFVSSSELVEKIKLGEDSLLELKAVTFGSDSAKVVGLVRADLADELAAMANWRGGVVVLGVDDKSREILGIPVDKLDAVEGLVREACRRGVTPPMTFTAVRMNLPDSTGQLRAVLKVEVPRSLFVHRSPTGYFYRQSSSRQEMPPDEVLMRLIRFDEQAVPDSAVDDLDEALARRFVPGTEERLDLVLQKMKIFTRDDQGMTRLSVAGALFCAREPERWLPNAFIEAVRYRGVMRDANYQLDAATIRGPLDTQIVNALSFVRRNMSTAARKGPGREEFPQYSERAVFEAIVNAVAHRDYSIHGSHIRLFMYDDRLELLSPGSFPNSITVESVALRQSTRNELITSLLGRLRVPGEGAGQQHFMEKRGEGVPIIQQETQKLAGEPAMYRVVDESEVQLTIPASRAPAEADG